MDELKKRRALAAAFAALLLAVAGYRALLAAPAGFVPGSVVRIAPEETASLAARELADAGVVSHAPVLLFILRISGASEQVRAGAYRFDAPQNVFAVARRLASGDYGLPPARLTFPEGFTAREAAEQIAKAFPGLSAEAFLAKARQHEGYLFPDTYFLPAESDAASIVALMRANFDTKTDALFKSASTTLSRSDAVILASVVEREARTMESKRLVAGILLNRLALGMPLQVDAVFGYIRGSETYSPSYADLKMDSPYNTYLHAGLPPGPISNPGLESLEAVLHPARTDYLFYLTGKDGLMHYAATHAGHQANRKKYLD